MVLILRHLGLYGTQFGEIIIELKKKNLAVRTRLNISKEDLGSKRKTPKCLLCQSVAVA